MASIAKVVVMLAIAVTLIAPFSTVIADNTGSVAGNDSVSAEIGTYQDLEGYNIDSGSFSAELDDGSSLSEGTDYELNSSAGTVKFLSAGAVSEGDTVNTSYQYDATDGTTSTITGLLPLLIGLLVLVPIANEVTERL